MAIKEAINGKQLDAIDKAYKAADFSIQEAISRVSDRVSVIEGFITSAGLNANNKKVTNIVDGEIVSEGKEAVNDDQLFTVKPRLILILAKYLKLKIN